MLGRDCGKLDGLAAEVVLRCWRYQLSQTRHAVSPLGTPGLDITAPGEGPWNPLAHMHIGFISSHEWVHWAIAAATTAWWSTSGKAPSGASSGFIYDGKRRQADVIVTMTTEQIRDSIMIQNRVSQPLPSIRPLLSPLARATPDADPVAVSGDNRENVSPRIRRFVQVRRCGSTARPSAIRSNAAGGQWDDAGHGVWIGAVRPCRQPLHDADPVTWRGHGEPQDIGVAIVPVGGTRRPPDPAACMDHPVGGEPGNVRPFQRSTRRRSGPGR